MSMPCLMGLLLLGSINLHAAELHVGPGKPFARVEDALAKAATGDVVLVHPLPEGKPYVRVALLVRTSRITIRAVPAKPGERVRLDGEGFDYSGSGQVPRAIVQFEPSVDSALLEGFELCNARNGSFNGAGVRINQANLVTVRGCEIHDNDMGVMSNGDLEQRTGFDQRIESCRIHHNGTDREPGQNHNLYLGGSGVTVRACEIFSSTTGHNLKSRAHDTRVEYCFLHDSCNRELDLVDGKANTAAAGSNAVLLGNLIIKKPAIDGNKTVIHFGQDGGGDHLGTLYLACNTIVTPYAAPVVDLSAPGASVRLVDNLIWDRGTGGGAHDLVTARNGGDLGHVSGEGNWLSAAFRLPAGVEVARNKLGRAGENPPFKAVEVGDFHLRAAGSAPVLGPMLPWEKLGLPLPLAMPPAKLEAFLQIAAPLTVVPRSDGAAPEPGAFAAQ